MTKYADEFLERVEKTDVDGILYHLWIGFPWGGSPEGHEYWSKIADRLEDLQQAKEKYDAKQVTIHP